MPPQLTYKNSNFRTSKRPENTPVFHSTSTGKEKDSETGYYYFGARYYNPDLSLWLSVDPMADKYPSLSPYNYCAWNPMKIVDPDGRDLGDFYDKYGRRLGSDGKNDGFVYVVKNGSDALCSTWDLVKAKTNVRFHKGKTKYFEKHPEIYDNFIKILPLDLLKEAYNTILDDGTGGTGAANNREYGGFANESGTGWEKTGIMSDVGDPRENEFMRIYGLMDGRVKFHSHASGSLYEAVGDNDPFSGIKYTSGSVGKYYGWNQNPSSEDIRKAANTTNYVFGMGDKTLSVYNRNGVQAKISLRGLFGL